MNRTTKIALTVGVVAAIGNVAIAWYTSAARTGRMLGENKWLDFNDSLVKYNPLAFLFPPSVGRMPTMPGMPVTVGATNFAAPPVAQVTDQATGTTTYYG